MWYIIILIVCGMPTKLTIEHDGAVVAEIPYKEAMADKERVERYNSLLDSGDAALVVLRSKDQCI
jgi:hypothetical protein